MFLNVSQQDKTTIQTFFFSILPLGRSRNKENAIDIHFVPFPLFPYTCTSSVYFIHHPFKYHIFWSFLTWRFGKIAWKHKQCTYSSIEIRSTGDLTFHKISITDHRLRARHSDAVHQDVSPQVEVDKCWYDTNLRQPQPDHHKLRPRFHKQSHDITLAVTSVMKVIGNTIGKLIHFLESPLLLINHDHCHLLWMISNSILEQRDHILTRTLIFLKNWLKIDEVEQSSEIKHLNLNKKVNSNIVVYLETIIRMKAMLISLPILLILSILCEINNQIQV